MSCGFLLAALAFLLSFGDLHEAFIHFVADAFARVLAPLNAVQGIIVYLKSAVFALYRSVYGKDLYRMPASRTLLFLDGYILFSLTSAHYCCHSIVLPFDMNKNTPEKRNGMLS